MATYRKPLKDIDGNFIIPAMTGDQTEWVQTGDIADNAVTHDKLALSAMNPFVMPWDSTNGSWFMATSGTTGKDISLGVDTSGNWHGLWDGYTSNWMITRNNVGSYVMVNDVPISKDYILYYAYTAYNSTDITISNINLNSGTYCKVGKYICRTGATGASQSNNPSGTAYQMWVINLNSDTLDPNGETWKYIGRLMLGINGMWW
ncbi:MAG: hypothetical protein K6D98_04095, partial [Clostridiales bacterium]|nr:hypothetical protein [Clostridiales bacterium]